MILLFFMNLVVVVTLLIVNYKILKLNNFLDSLLSLFILYFAQIVFTELTLGFFGALYIRNIILINLFIFFVIYIATLNKDFLKYPVLKDTWETFLSNRLALFLFAIILSFGLNKIFINLINPPFGWDSLNYHFVFPVEWLKHGNLHNPITISDEPSASYYPINGSLFFFWLMFPLRNVFAADLGQVPFFIAAFLAVYGIARKIGLDRLFSFYAASLFFITPNFFKQLSFAYVDVMVAALFLVCVNFILSLNKSFSRTNVLVYSLSLGLLLGTKTVALPYSVLLFVPFVYLAIKNKKRAYLAIILLFAVVVFGGYSYIRNFFITGNPLYPLNFKIFGKVIFKGVIDTSMYGAHFKIEDYSLAKLLFHEGLGIQGTIFVLPAVFLALPAAFFKKRKIPDFILAYFLLLPIFIFLAYRFIIPLANTRYLYPLLGIGIILGFYTAQNLGIPRIVTKGLTAICAIASMTELAKRNELVTSIVLTLLLFSLLPLLIKYARLLRSLVFISLFSALIICSLVRLEKDYLKNEYQRYSKMVKYSGFWPDAAAAWNWLNKNTKGDNIAYIGRPVPFPLYGTNFKNNVYYVSVNKTEPAKLHYFKDSSYSWGYDFLSVHKSLEEKGNYRSDADYSVWVNNLVSRNTDFLFVYSLHQTKEIIFPLEDFWAKANQEKFVPVFTNQTMHIYKIKK